MADEMQRQGRAAQEAQRRRRRGSEGLEADRNLHIPPEIEAKLKAEGRTPRWVNDERNRIHRFTVQDDYDKVDGVEPVPVGTDKQGNPILAHLLSKPTQFIEEDRADADRRRSAIEKGLFRSPDAVKQAGQGAAPEATAEQYVDPNSKLSGRRRNEIAEG